ncbi:MAG: hypothetical protein COA97_02520 [Flavobacteriales bacterium]|nr:MAG: hypothetical protein COA97_02520 [Flavobacteriales bacterium]
MENNSQFNFIAISKEEWEKLKEQLDLIATKINSKDENTVTDILDEYVSEQRFREFLNVSQRTMQRIVLEQQALNYVSIGKRKFFHQDDIKKFLSDHRIDVPDRNDV